MEAGRVDVPNPLQKITLHTIITGTFCHCHRKIEHTRCNLYRVQHVGKGFGNTKYCSALMFTFSMPHYCHNQGMSKFKTCVPRILQTNIEICNLTTVDNLLNLRWDSDVGLELWAGLPGKQTTESKLQTLTTPDATKLLHLGRLGCDIKEKS